MANGLGSIAATQRDPAAMARALLHANVYSGRIRWFESRYVVPAAGGPIVGERITWGRLPTRAKVVPLLSRMQWSAGAASSTLTVGDEVTTNRYLAATSVTAAGGSLLTDPSGAPLLYEVTSGVQDTDPNPPNVDNVIVSVVAGAALQAGQAITLRLAYVID